MIFLLSGLALLGLAVFALIRLRRTPGEEGDSLAMGAGCVLFIGVSTVLISGIFLILPPIRGIVQESPLWLKIAIGTPTVVLGVYVCSVFMFELCGVIYRWARGQSDEADETVGFWARRHIYALLGTIFISIGVFTAISYLENAVIGALVLALGVAALSFYHPWIMPWFLYYRAKSLDLNEYAQVHQWLNDVAEKHRVPKFHLRVQDGRMVNALASGGVYRHFIVIGRGLLDTFSVDHLKAILAHEVGHVLNGDLSRRRVSMVCITVALYAPYLYFVVFPLEGFMRAFALFVGLLLVYSLPSFVTRRHEFDADKKAVEIMGDAEVVAQALERFCEVNESPMDQRSMTHPTMRARVDAIRRLGEERREGGPSPA